MFHLKINPSYEKVKQVFPAPTPQTFIYILNSEIHKSFWKELDQFSEELTFDRATKRAEC